MRDRQPPSAIATESGTRSQSIPPSILFNLKTLVRKFTGTAKRQGGNAPDSEERLRDGRAECYNNDQTLGRVYMSTASPHLPDEV